MTLPLKIEDLYQQCEKCGGTGKVDRAGGSTSPFGYHPIGSSETCTGCGGNGGKLTDDGRVLKNFIDLLSVKQKLR